MAVVGKRYVSQLKRLAEPLRGLRVVNVNSTKEGGGVAEILNRTVPLMSELGLNVRWEIIEGDAQFFRATKAMHNSLQGDRITISRDDLDHYVEVNRRHGGKIDFDADVVVIHDPQPAALIENKNAGQHWVWRCHIDIARPWRDTWEFLRKYVERYECSIFSMAKFSQNLPHPQYIIAPAIDPLSDKNRDMLDAEAREIVESLGVNTDKPLIVQVSRFDRFKDPIGVIRAFKIARSFNDCTLVLAGGGATDDPEGEEVYRQVLAESEGDPDIHVLMLPPDAHKVINAIQAAATIIVQKSTKEGFGLTVTEGMWKGKPVIGGAVGGITTQIFDYLTGFLVHSVEGAAYRMRYALNRPEMMKKIGRNAKEFVRTNYLITRNVRDYLILFHSIRHGHVETIQL
ncbi:MAG: glycosyltransferase [Deltaproteobacteria bacterium]|nr:glycosyltransferase [Deltaproteobacteria bacterium]NIS76695.1 glycosyltransferase [Deltaproteobacteria bacterium]